MVEKSQFFVVVFLEGKAMFESLGIWIGLAVFSAATVVVLSLRLAGSYRERALEKARSTFSLRREWLEAEFLKLANQRGIPRGLRWVDIDFEDSVQFAKDRSTGQLRALVGVTIKFEAIEGGDMEDVEAVGNLRAGTAVFYFDQNAWATNGRALFNVNPIEAIEHYGHELETVD